MLIIIQNVKGLNAPSKGHTLAEWIKKTRTVYRLSIRDLYQNLGHTQIENEGMKKDIPCKWKSKESQSSNFYIRQNRP